MSSGLHAIDIAIILFYALGMLLVGWIYSRRAESTDEYFVGNRSMPPLLIGVSLFATLLSTISYLSSPGEMIRHGPVMLAGLASIPIAYGIVGYAVIPAFMRFRLTSAYELLEKQLGIVPRLTGAAMFSLLRLMWMAVLLNFAAKALLVMTGLENHWMIPVTIGIGLVALFYSTLGGLRAVVVTDCLQFILLFGGALLVIGIITYRMGGMDWVPTSWNPDWDEQPFFSLNPRIRLTVVGVIVMQTLWAVCTMGSDQTVVQRYMATGDTRAARQSFLVKSIVSAVVMLTLACVGFALLGYFQSGAAVLPPDLDLRENADGLFPYFIAHELPPGLSGLVISGMFAAAMSSVDSGVNSISAVVLTDCVDRFRAEPLKVRLRLWLARCVTVAVGVIVITGSTLIDYVPGNFLEVSKRVTGLLVTPLFTLFFMAIFIPFATSAGTVLGAGCGFLTALVIAYWNPLFSDQSLPFMWINPCALTVSVTVGCAVSWATVGRKGQSRSN